MDKIPSYAPGSSVRLVWPAKNHANYECFDWIPDTEMKLYWNPEVNPSADLENTEGTMEDQGYELVKDWHDGCTPGTDGIAEYITEIPVCIEGQSYSADDVAVFVEAQFEFTLQSVTETAILNVSESSTGYEFTAKVTHDDEGADVADIATNDFCSEFEAEYGSSVDCDISDECGEMRTYAVMDPEIPDDAITVTSTQSMGAWYLNFVMEHIDDCFDEIAAVQLVRGDGVYQDHDQYWYGS